MGNRKRVIIPPDLTVKELFDNHPEIIDVFIELKLACIGCPIDRFHTLVEIAEAYHLDPDFLFSKIQTAIKKADQQ